MIGCFDGLQNLLAYGIANFFVTTKFSEGCVVGSIRGGDCALVAAAAWIGFSPG
jgi:hypothetical protein